MEFEMASSLSNSIPLWPRDRYMRSWDPGLLFGNLQFLYLLHCFGFGLLFRLRFNFGLGLLFCFRFGMTISLSLIYSSHSSSESWSLKCSRSGSLWLSHFFKKHGWFHSRYSIVHPYNWIWDDRVKDEFNDKETINSKNYRPLYYNQPFYRSNWLKQANFRYETNFLDQNISSRL